MPKGQETTTKFKVDISELKASMQEAQRQIRLANSEFKSATGGMDNWGKSADGVSAKIKQLDSILSAQKSILSSLESQYRQVADSQGENSKGAQELLIKINNQKAAIGKTEKELRNYNEALDELENESDDAKKHTDELGNSLDDAGDSADGAEGKLSRLAKGLGGGIVAGLKAVGVAATGLITAFLASGEASQEYMEDMGKLETAFTSAGHTAETAEKSYRGMVGILGETDQSVEAVNHLAQLTDSTEELSKWTDIAAGVYGTFGDSLPLEGLTEAANETAKVGQVTGPLADALNWAGVSEDEFNQKLAACNSEQERATLITNTLNGLYADAAGKYKEINGSLIEARQAQADFNGAMAEVGKLAMPITTKFKQMGASLLTELLPSIKQVSEAFLGMLNGEQGSDAKFGEAISNTLISLVGKITEVIPTLLTVGTSIITSLIQGIISAAPQMMSTGLEIIKYLYDTIITGVPKIIEAGSEILMKLGEGVKTGIPDFVNKALDALDGFVDMLATNLPKLLKAGISFITNMVQGIVNALPDFIAKAPEIITKFANLINDNGPTILKAAVNIILTLIKGIISAIPTLIANVPKIIRAIVSVWEAFNWMSLGKNAITFLKNGITSMVSAVKSAGKNILDSITNIIRELPSKLYNLGRNGISDLGEAIYSMAGHVGSAARNIVYSIVDIISSLPSKMLSIGSDVVRGLWNGISDMTGWVINKIRGFGDSVLGGIKNFFGINSPSTLFRDEVGKFLPEGMAEGVLKNAKSVYRAIKDLGKETVTIAQDELSGATYDLGAGNNKSNLRTDNYKNNSVVNNYNFTQNNTSPKSLSRLDIYRQTKNLFGVAAT